MPNPTDKPNFQSLYYMTGEIRGEVKGIIERLDKINGRINNHGDRINQNENDVLIIKTKAGVWGGIMGFIISVIVSIIGFFLKK